MVCFDLKFIFKCFIPCLEPTGNFRGTQFREILKGASKLKGGMSQSTSTNLTLCQLYYVYLHEYVVQITYAPLEASAFGIREVSGCTPIRIDSVTHHHTVYTCNDLELLNRG